MNTGVATVCVCLTGLCVESAGVEEVSGEVDVDVAEEEQHVASLPGSGPDVETPSPRKLLVQLQQSVVLKINFPAVTRKTKRGFYAKNQKAFVPSLF